MGTVTVTVTEVRGNTSDLDHPSLQANMLADLFRYPTGHLCLVGLCDHKFNNYQH